MYNLNKWFEDCQHVVVLKHWSCSLRSVGARTAKYELHSPGGSQMCELDRPVVRQACRLPD